MNTKVYVVMRHGLGWEDDTMYLDSVHLDESAAEARAEKFQVKRIDSYVETLNVGEPRDKSILGDA